ncbi:MAG: hypothetical protein K6E19_10735, partial [Lachnospiraceae bacterium]|nr:hypothetical protein [Lachnospiraceae bacterium]
MRSIRTQLLALVYGSVIAVFGILAGMVMINYRGLVESTAKEEMILITDKYSEELNDMFSTVERACAGMTDYLSLKPDFERLVSDNEYADAFYVDLAIRGSKSADIVGNVYSVYFRPDPTVYGSESGMLMVNNGYGEYMRSENTDILDYLENDREYVAWYYEPVAAGHAVWLEPYLNRNLNVYMISYVVPVYSNGKLFGVFGMDIAMSSILKVIDSVDYGEGFAYLVGKEGDILYHKDYPDGVKEIMLDDDLGAAVDFLIYKRTGDYSVGRYKYKGKACRLMGADLHNGMKL